MGNSIIGANAVRISRLLANGTPDYGNALGSFLVCGGISTFEHDFEIEQGASIFVRDAAGNPCVNRKRQDDVKYATFTLTMCRDDYRLTEILLAGGATLLTDDGDYPIGRGIKASGSCGETVVPTGVAIELWSELWDCDVPNDPPYQRAVLPRAFLTPKGFRREDGVSLPVYSGYAVANPNFDNGPFSDLDEVVADIASLVYFEIDDDALPTCASPLNYLAIPAHTS